VLAFLLEASRQRCGSPSLHVHAFSHTGVSRGIKALAQGTAPAKRVMKVQKAMKYVTSNAACHGWGSPECTAAMEAVTAALYSLGQAMAGNHQLVGPGSLPTISKPA